MEDQNRFDLEKALLTWKEDCASRPGISFEDAMELESDLRERVADLRQRGLGEKEAFGLAVRQVGSPAELAREFARENPLAVWRERVMWMTVAGFAVSVWHYLAGGTIIWFHRTFGPLLPFSFPVWASLAGQLPVLAAAVLTATGRLDNLAGRLLRSRRQVALTGGGVLITALLVRLFGPDALSLPGGWLLRAAFVLHLSLWPLILLSLGIVLFRPYAAGIPGPSAFRTATVPAAVWRARVCWMAVGGLMVGFWKTVSLLSVQALFYTGNTNSPFEVNPLVLTSVYLLTQVSPLVALGFYFRHRMKAGKDISAGRLFQRRALFALIPVVVCAWTVLYLWSQYYWRPRGVEWGAGIVLRNYFMTGQWLWPLGLAALILWLAPKRSAQDQHSEPAE